MESFIHLRKGTTPRRLHADLDGLKDDDPRIIKAKERTRLFVLLALNCGYYACDIATLEKSMLRVIDDDLFVERRRWRDARILRPRAWRNGRDHASPCLGGTKAGR